MQSKAMTKKMTMNMENRSETKKMTMNEPNNEKRITGEDV